LKVELPVFFEEKGRLGKATIRSGRCGKREGGTVKGKMKKGTRLVSLQCGKGPVN